MLKDMGKAIFDESAVGKERRIIAQKLIKIAKAKTIRGALRAIGIEGDSFPILERAALDKALTLVKTEEELKTVFEDYIEVHTQGLQGLLLWRYGFEQVLRKADELGITPLGSVY